jgi:hypothetical protein
VNERTKDQRRSVPKHLEKWLGAKGFAATVEAITKQAAGAYVTDSFITRRPPDHWQQQDQRPVVLLVMVDAAHGCGAQSMVWPIVQQTP